ncbi:MAG: Gx transporter family protein [Candidatus Cloacimonadales bacterium]|nr:Gx transporter family protein [Candidatus Cloacimonadales bacterium]
MNILDFSELTRQRYIVVLAFFTACAVTVYILESFIPKPLPFMKLGLSNVVVLVLLMAGNLRSAFLVALAKTLIGGMFTGTLISPTTLLSGGGTILSFFIMILLLKLPLNFSIPGISIAGAVSHNFAQISLVRLFLIKENSLFYLTPLLILMGIVTGIITGYLAKLFLDKMDFSLKME